MPTGLVDDDDGMCSGSNGDGDFLEMERHGFGVALGQHQCRANAPRWTDGAKDIGRTRALILGGRGTCSSFRPAPGDFVLLSDPGFVLPPNLYDRPWWETVSDFRHSGREVFLNADIASGSWAWWRGRAVNFR